MFADIDKLPVIFPPTEVTVTTLATPFALIVTFEFAITFTLLLPFEMLDVDIVVKNNCPLP